MKATLTWSHDNSFAIGIRDGIPIALGYIPAAITFGFLSQTTGLTAVESILMSLLVFTGAAQFMALSLLAAGTGSVEIIFTTFILNIRHLLMSASLHEKAAPDRLIRKVIYAFGITDEVFAVTATKEGQVRTGYIFGVSVIAYMSWVIHTGVGYAVGGFLPDVLQQSLTFALYALFIALLAPSMKKHRKVLVLAAFAAVLNSMFSLFMADGWSIILATILSASLVELVEPSYQKQRKGGET
ncbi:AzlC family ABC transporter permease [Alteribacillus iranensis]|uniref:4-azaleucine resistance probable transporter AzlC n=1 Tax=Alteribacillus iranensis TaxID=930128 RepID=A0A1I2CY75_9BACI|nr:AzlC family ABC transporter permease [Alteribacillus iranensis]SFE72743.1 4-azaleucine resistance probable transporter AzlC [Alteribacillus iranensis]